MAHDETVYRNFCGVFADAASDQGDSPADQEKTGLWTGTFDYRRLLGTDCGTARGDSGRIFCFDFYDNENSSDHCGNHSGGRAGQSAQTIWFFGQDCGCAGDVDPK